jgi:hypothetical protein
MQPTINPQGKPLRRALLAAGLSVVLLASCAGPQATAGMISVELDIDGVARTYQVPAGSTVRQSIETAGYSLAPLDRTEPPAYTVLTDGALVTVTRVSERFEIEEIVLPFERQTVRNEGLPEGETRLLQAGRNGLQEITNRILTEAGQEISRTPVKTTVIEPAQPEIIMIGAQASFAPVTINGRLAYLSGGNAWLMENTTGNRRPLTLSGDLDGRVFDLSPAGDWLLFTRAEAEQEDTINSLWALPLEAGELEPMDLGADNIVHFAAWAPTSDRLVVAYSTVEPSAAAPGWQANNDLVLVNLTQAGRVLGRETLIAANAGGQYGWWGTDYFWAPDAVRLAFSRADAVGIVDSRSPSLDGQWEVTPFQTLSDWAWVPGVAWGADSRTLFYVNHGPPIGLEGPTASPVFELSVQAPQGGGALKLATQSGMFALPSTSPALVRETGEVAYAVAFYQAIDPLSSQDSSYRLMVIDRDGSNMRTLFPAPDQPGLRGDDLQQPVVWSPDGDLIAVRSRGDLWIVEAASGQAQQITGDGQTAAFDWADG